jgi:ribosome-associated protein
MDIRKMEKAVVAALEDIKARDIVVLKVAHLSPLFERIIIASADSTRQVKALADNVRDKLKALGATVISTEGEESGEWVLVDLGAIVVHVMQPAIRQYYNLEELWDQPEPKRPRARKNAAHVQAAAH